MPSSTVKPVAVSCALPPVYKTSPLNNIRGLSLVLILTLAGCFSLLLALHAGLFVMLALANLLNDACACALALKPLQSALQRLVFADSYLGHCYPSSRSSRLDISRLRRTDGEPYCYYIAFQGLRQWGIFIFLNNFVRNLSPFFAKG